MATTATPISDQEREKRKQALVSTIASLRIEDLHLDAESKRIFQRHVPALAGDRDQLWAEAKVRFESGCVWWLDTADLVQLASDQQEARYEGDPWEEVVGPWLQSKQTTAISEVLEKCINKPQAQWTQTDKIRASRCLRAQGWVRFRERQGDRLEWRYRKVV